MTFPMTYKGRNNFGFHRFSVSTHDPETFNRIEKMRQWVDEKGFNTNNPFYRKDGSNFISMTCKCDKHLTEKNIGELYDVNVSVYKKICNDKIYINVSTRVNLLKKVDHGEEIHFD